MPKVPPPPPGVDIDLGDKDVQKAAAMIQKSFRGHRVRKKMLEDGPPKFMDELQDVTTMEMSSVRLDCRLAGFPDPTVKWYKEGQELKEGVKYRIIFEDPDICALSINSIELSDAARYTCKAFNQFGEAFDSAILSVQAPAKIEKGPPNVRAQVGETIVLKVSISGTPAPEVGWAKGENDIEEDERVFYDINEDDDTTVLTIKNCTKKDAGKYECYVENDLGQDHTFSRVEVK